MKDNKILASVALFGELFDSKKDVYDVIAEFLKAAIINEAKWSFTSIEATELLDVVYEFDLPDAVVKSTLKNRLKRDEFVTLTDGVYSCNIEKLKNNSTVISKEFETLRSNHSHIFSELVSYIAVRKNLDLTDVEKAELEDNFNSFLLEGGTNEKNFDLISSFIISNKDTLDFTQKLNAIKEGLVIYTGVKYTSDLNNLGTWTNPFTIFLDTEHLFNLMGYNGSIYKEIFDDFYKLCTEINNANPKKASGKIIQLKYFEEVKKEVDNFFHVAQLIIDGKIRLDPSKAAMQEILNGCHSASDIIQKKVKFFEILTTKRISIEIPIDYYKSKVSNIEDQAVIEKLKKDANDSKINFDEGVCVHYLKLFTKINVLRRNINNNSFERIGFILVTGNRSAQYWAHNQSVKVQPWDIPFATEIDFITDKFWFALKRGFGDKKDLPKSFDIITRAQIVLSSQMQNSISKRYNELNAKVKNGQLTEESAISAYSEYRGMHFKPEEIVEAVLDNSLDFLNDNRVERYNEEKAFMLRQLGEGEKAKQELRKIRTNEILKKKKRIKITTKLFYCAALSLSIIFGISLLLIIGYLIVKVISPEDTKISIIHLCIAVSELLIVLVSRKFLIKCNHFLKRKCKDYYVNSIKGLYS